MNDRLHAWLDIALCDVEPARRSRLRAELLDHFTHAQADYQARGLDREAAGAAALADLGDPQLTAAALRQAGLAQPPQRQAAAVTHWGVPAVFALLALLAVHTLRLPLAQPPDAEVSVGTGLALLLQVASLTIAVSLPLLFDDLDLSVGVVVLLGAYLVRAPDLTAPSSFWLAQQPTSLPLVLLLTALAGAAFGLLNGVLIVALRLPPVLVTIGTGVALAAVLLRQPDIHLLPLGTPERITSLAPTLLVGAMTIGLLGLGSGVAARRWRAPAPDAGPAPTMRERLLELRRGALLVLPLVLALGLVRWTWAAAWSLALLAAVGAVCAAGAAWAYGAADTSTRRTRVHRLQRWMLGLGLGVWLVLLPIGGAYLVNTLLSVLLLLVLSVLIALALAVLLRGVWAGRGRMWLRLTRAPLRAPAARIAALVLCSSVAAAVGGCVGAQGIRDGTAVHATAFYVVVPLAGLIIGGQHRLSGWRRPVGALLGALVVAGLTPLGSDNLDSPMAALLLAAVFACAWRLVLPPPRPLAVADARAAAHDEAEWKHLLHLA